MKILKNLKVPQLKTSSIAALAGRVKASIRITQMDEKKARYKCGCRKSCTATNQSPFPSQFSWC